jgi:hypothetical protein
MRYFAGILVFKIAAIYFLVSQTLLSRKFFNSITFRLCIALNKEYQLFSQIYPIGKLKGVRVSSNPSASARQNEYYGSSECFSMLQAKGEIFRK